MKASQTRKQIVEIASWRLMTEYMRHLSPEHILIEYHPGMGYGNSLAIINRKTKHILIDYSRSGHHNIFPVDPHKSSYTNTQINKDVFTKDMKEILDTGLRFLNLPITKKLPPSTPQVLTYRTITTILTQATFSKSLWVCKNGCLDSSVDGYAQRTELFALFPEALKRTADPKKTDYKNNPNYNFWFVLKDENPVCCLETNGTLWTTTGTKFDICAEYKKNRYLSSLIAKAIGHQLE